MNNFPVIVNNKEYWISRSVAVVGCIFTEDNGIRVLAVKRGKGCPDEVGKWCLPCGYVDYNETLKEACVREVKEETNLTLDRTILYKWGVDDKPEGRQNISIRYYSFGSNYKNQTITGAFAEKDEVDDVKWINIEDFDKYDWAFNHKQLIIQCVLSRLGSHIAIPRKIREKLEKIK